MRAYRPGRLARRDESDDLARQEKLMNMLRYSRRAAMKEPLFEDAEYGHTKGRTSAGRVARA